MYKAKRVIISNLRRVITKLGYMDKERERLYNKGGNEEEQVSFNSAINKEVEPPHLSGTPPKEGKCRDTKGYMRLPYNPKLKQRAKELRKAGNYAEVLFWKQVRNK